MMYEKRIERIQRVRIRRWKLPMLCIGMLGFGIWLLGYRARPNLRIACLDVGQGDGIVLEIEGTWNLLIDGGSSNKSAVGQYQILPYLKSRGISRLDGIFISHTDGDHISGTEEILEYVGKGLTSIRVDHLILPDWEEEPENYLKLRELAQTADVQVLQVKAGDRICYGNAQLDILWPEKGAVGEDVNEEAMVMELEYGKFKGLFTGDIGMETEKKLQSAHRLEDVDFLKVAHHGSRYSTGEEFLNVVKPELAVISCSASNTYGHPSPETLRRLENAGTEICRIDRSGAVIVEVDEEKMKVQRFVID